MRHALSVTVLNVFLPALAFGLVVAARFDSSFILIPLAGGLVIIAGLAMGYAAYTLLPWFKNIPRPVFGVMLFAAAFGNITFLGLPIITEMFGTEQGYVAILFDQFASTPLLLTVGVLIASRYGSGKNVSLPSSLKRVLLLPPLWGAAAGILVHVTGMNVPRLVLDTTALMGKAVIPIMIFTVGLALDFTDVKRLALIIPALGLKLLLAPVAAWLIGSRLGLTGDTLKALTIEGAMPVMVISLMIADEFELDVPLTAMCITASTVALFFTLPVIMKVLF